uniref:Apolipoprotein M n=1 Tax=Dicentrarchus labrax TaxID=13489 RepID=A0A8P4K9X0_DICLA
MISDMFTVCAIAIFCMVSVGHSAPLACEDAVRPLVQLDPHHLEGTWALVAASLSDPVLLEFFKCRNSSSVNFSNASATSDIVYTPSVNAGGKCHFQSYNVSLEGSILTFDEQHQVNLTGIFLYTSCPDCLVMRFDNQLKKVMRLHLVSRRREVEPKEMEEFRAQVECLNMPAPVVMDPSKELCPEQSQNIIQPNQLMSAL